MARRDLMDVSARNHNLPAFIFIVARHGAIAETIKQIGFRNAKVGHMVNKRPVNVTVIRLTIIRPRHIKAYGVKHEMRKRVFHGISPLGGMPKTTIPFYAQRSTKIVKKAHLKIR